MSYKQLIRKRSSCNLETNCLLCFLKFGWQLVEWLDWISHEFIGRETMYDIQFTFWLSTWFSTCTKSVMAVCGRQYKVSITACQNTAKKWIRWSFYVYKCPEPCITKSGTWLFCKFVLTTFISAFYYIRSGRKCLKLWYFEIVLVYAFWNL